MRQDEPLSRETFSEIDHELENIDRLREELKKALGEDSALSRRVKGSIVHDFYNMTGFLLPAPCFRRDKSIYLNSYNKILIK